MTTNESVLLHTLRKGARFHLPLGGSAREGKVVEHGTGSSTVEVLRKKTRTKKVKDQSGNVVKDANGHVLTEDELVEVQDAVISRAPMEAPAE